MPLCCHTRAMPAPRCAAAGSPSGKQIPSIATGRHQAVLFASTHAGLGNQLLHALSVALLAGRLRSDFPSIRCTIQLQPWKYGTGLLAALNSSAPRLMEAVLPCTLRMATSTVKAVAREQLLGSANAVVYDGRSPLRMNFFHHAWSAHNPRPVYLRPPASYTGGCSVPGLLRLRETSFAEYWLQMRRRALHLKEPSLPTNDSNLCIHLRGRDREHSTDYPSIANSTWYKSMAMCVLRGRRQALDVAERLASSPHIMPQLPNALLVSSPYPDIFESQSMATATHTKLRALPRVASSPSMDGRSAITNLQLLCTCSALVSEETPRDSTYTLLAELMCDLRPCPSMAQDAGAPAAWMVACKMNANHALSKDAPNSCDRQHDVWR